MKLFQTYKSIIDLIQPVETAWIATFNLDVELTERFLLSKLGNKEPSELKTAEDYEGLNLELQNINIKVWHDYRALNMRVGKRTTTDFISVDPTKFYGSKSNDIVFHPKVIFLKGNGGAYIITGSANLSISAWSSNREAIFVKEIKNRDNALEIINFFERLHAISGESPTEFEELYKWSAKLSREKSSWSFFHSFSKESSLFDKLESNHLTIWSPYFSKKPTQLFRQLLDKGFNKITVVPHINESGKVGITQDELNEIKSLSSIRLAVDRNNEIQKNDSARLAHAKVWLTPSQIAVGSWNCSFQATGLNTARSSQNIEAGIISTITDRDYRALLSCISDLDNKSINGTSESELAAEWAEVLNPYTIECKLIADWETFTYSIVCEKQEGLFISLPDAPSLKISLSEVDGKSFQQNYQKVLKDKTFTIYNSMNEVKYSGFILEKGKKKRQAYSYTTFFDLFDSLLYDPAGETARKQCQYKLDEELDEDESRREPVISYRGHESYYMMFVAFQKLFDTIDQYRNNPKKLDEIGFRLPGSLTRISGLLKETVCKEFEELTSDKTLFYYFLGQEINHCIEYFNELSDMTIPIIEVEYLFQKLNPSMQDNNFIKKLKREFEYSNGAK